MAIRNIKDFIRLEAGAGIVLFVFAVLALIISNTPWQFYYERFFDTPFSVTFGQYGIEQPLLNWVNNGLMTIFFLLVGLEIKRELMDGELSTKAKAALPIVAALGGMLVPALIFVFINWGDPRALQGWAIPTATDIAFSLGILSLLGSRVPVSLKIFLTALAIFDDIAAVVIIAVFYTERVWFLSIFLAGFFLILLYILNRSGVRRIAPYFLVGFLLWLCVLESGVHATLAGVALAFAIPLRGKEKPGEPPLHRSDERSPLRRLEKNLHPWVAFLVLPFFAFANAGISFHGLVWHNFIDGIPLGIIAGLFIGKQVGVFGASWLAIKLKIAHMPRGATWRGIYGVALICGVGFTMSLFIGMLAYDHEALYYAAMLRFGVLVGSFLSGIFGYFVLRCGCPTQADGDGTAPFSDHLLRGDDHVKN